MKFTPLPLAGAHLIDLEKRGDERGFFARFFCEAEFAKQGMNPVGNTPAEFAKMLAEDLERWTKVIKEAGIEQQ